MRPSLGLCSRALKTRFVAGFQDAIGSLLWFLGDNGKKFLQDIKKYQSLSFEKQEIILEDNPVAPPTEIVKKPTSVKDFLNIFNKK